MTANQAKAFDLYISAETKAGKSFVHSISVISNLFCQVVAKEHDNPVRPEDVPVDHLQTRSWSKMAFFRSLISTTFHVEWRPYQPPPVGAGNTILLQFGFKDGNYTVSHIGFQGLVSEYVLEDPEYWIVSSNSIVVRSGLVEFNVKRLNGTKKDGENVWVTELSENRRLLSRYYMLPITF